MGDGGHCLETGDEIFSPQGDGRKAKTEWETGERVFFSEKLFFRR